MLMSGLCIPKVQNALLVRALSQIPFNKILVEMGGSVCVCVCVRVRACVRVCVRVCVF